MPPAPAGSRPTPGASLPLPLDAQLTPSRPPAGFGFWPLTRPFPPPSSQFVEAERRANSFWWRGVGAAGDAAAAALALPRRAFGKHAPLALALMCGAVAAACLLPQALAWEGGRGSSGGSGADGGAEAAPPAPVSDGEDDEEGVGMGEWMVAQIASVLRGLLGEEEPEDL